MIPYARQDISPQDIEAVIDVLKSNWLTQGPTVQRFEKIVADYCGAQHAVAVNSGTSALHIACRALGLGPDDMLWTSPNTFVASANCARYCGAHVDFVDIDPHTYNISVPALAAKLESASRNGGLPNVIVAVHFAGQPCDMRGIRGLADQYGCQVIEDASHAIGAEYKECPVGGGQFSDLTIFSFHPVKLVTTGEGGLITTNRDDLFETLCLLRSHGITRDLNRMRGQSEGSWYYQQVDLGYNYRMTDIQAALGISQMQRLPDFISRRRELVVRYNELLRNLPIGLPFYGPDCGSAWHLYVVRLNLAKVSKSRQQVFNAMRANGIGVNVHYIPVHLHPYYRDLGFGPGDFPEAERYYAEAVTLPLYVRLSNSEQDFVVQELVNALN